MGLFRSISVVLSLGWFGGGLWFFSSLQCDSYEIRPGKHLGVCISVANNRLFVGSIPKNKTKENILEEFSKVTGKTKMHLEVGLWKSVALFININVPPEGD